MLSAFLAFLARDISDSPERLTPLSLSRADALVAGIDIDLDDEITDEK